MGSMALGRVQLRIMQVLWDKQQATAREITDAINSSEPIAHSTVQTMLRVLEDKKAVAHKPDGRTFVFYPLVPEAEFKQSATQNLVERVFGGSVSNLLAHLIDCDSVSKKEIDEIRKLINRQNKR
jgi:BlaI family transcriptional regulator, penicillinase repressor